MVQNIELEQFHIDSSIEYPVFEQNSESGSSLRSSPLTSAVRVLNLGVSSCYGRCQSPSWYDNPQIIYWMRFGYLIRCWLDAGQNTTDLMAAPALENDARNDKAVTILEVYK